MIQYNLDNLIRGLDAFQVAMEDKIKRGLEQAAVVLEAYEKATIAHGDMSGATRASYSAIVYGDGLEAQANAVAQNRYEQAAALLEFFDGHDGEPFIEPIHINVNGHFGILLTSYTNYQQELEVSEKATLGPTLELLHEEVTEIVKREPLRSR